MQIIKGNSYCRVEKAEKAHLELLKDALTYTDKEVHFEVVQTRQKLQYAIYRRNNKLAWGLKKKLELLESQVEV
jgi:hypothetical protein